MVDVITPADRHSTTARAQFAAEFAAAVSAIRRLDQRDPKWARRAPPPPLPKAGGYDPLTTSFQGQETTQQLSYKPYDIGDAPISFRPVVKHRKRKDEETEFMEAIFRQKQLFGKRPK